MNICYLEHASDVFALKLFLVLNKKIASKNSKSSSSWSSPKRGKDTKVSLKKSSFIIFTVHPNFICYINCIYYKMG